MLVSAKEMLQKAKAGHYAVGQFNINNLECVQHKYECTRVGGRFDFFIVPKLDK